MTQTNTPLQNPGRFTGIIPGNLEGGVVTEGSFSFFRVRDPDGNLIEFYAVKAP